MWISDTSVKRPVFAAVISLLLVILGVLALQRLPVREYPDVDPTVVSVDTSYRGASAEVVERKITADRRRRACRNRRRAEAHV